MRRFAGHAVLVVAAFASIATSKPRWQVTAPPPSTRVDAALGTLAVIEASHHPGYIRCLAAGHPDQLAALRSDAGRRYEYACPPGTQFSEALIDGRGSQPPDDAFVRFVEVRPVKMWRAEASTTIPVITQDVIGGSSYTWARAQVVGALIGTIDVSLAPGADPMLHAPTVSMYGPNGFSIEVSAYNTEPHRALLAVHAVGYGVCDQECTPGQVTVEQLK